MSWACDHRVTRFRTETLDAPICSWAQLYADRFQVTKLSPTRATSAVAKVSRSPAAQTAIRNCAVRSAAAAIENVTMPTTAISDRTRKDALKALTESRSSRSCSLSAAP